MKIVRVAALIMTGMELRIGLAVSGLRTNTGASKWWTVGGKAMLNQNLNIVMLHTYSDEVVNEMEAGGDDQMESYIVK